MQDFTSKIPLLLCFCLLSLSANSDSNSGSRSINNKEPTVDLIEELEMDNVYWTAEQLDQMSSETLIAAVEILGSIPDFSADQLLVLSTKAIKVHYRGTGPVSVW